MEKRNVVEQKRTPTTELNRQDENWDKSAAELFNHTQRDQTVQAGKPIKCGGPAHQQYQRKEGCRS